MVSFSIYHTLHWCFSLVTSLVYWCCRSMLYMSCTYNSLKKPKIWLSLALVLSSIIKINDFWGPIMDVKTPRFQWCLTPYNDSLFTQTLNNTSKCNLQGDWKRVNILNHVCWSHFDAENIQSSLFQHLIWHQNCKIYHMFPNLTLKKSWTQNLHLL